MRMTAFWSLLKRYKFSRVVIVKEDRADGFVAFIACFHL